MKKTGVVAFGVVLMACALLPLLTTADTATDKENLARNLVVECAKVTKGDIVYLYGGIKDIELLEDLAINVRRQGAFPLLTIGSDRLTRRMFDDVPAEFDSQSPLADMKIAEMIDVQIGIAYNEDMQILAHVPVERLAAVGAANAPIVETIIARNVRQVYLGNGMNPTPDRAKIMGVNVEELAKIYWSGVMTDPSLLSAYATDVKSAMAKGKRIRITNANGTDLQLEIESRPIFATMGHISDEDIKNGGAACQVWLPAGEVFTSPVPGTATGKVVVERHIHQGKPIENLVLKFENGRLTDMTASSGLEPLAAMYDAAGEGKDEFAFVDIGINPDVKIQPGTDMYAFMASGMVTIGVGGNTWAGGENTCPFLIALFLRGSTLEIDGEPLVKEGTLMVSID